MKVKIGIRVTCLTTKDFRDPIMVIQFDSVCSMNPAVTEPAVDKPLPLFHGHFKNHSKRNYRVMPGLPVYKSVIRHLEP